MKETISCPLGSTCTKMVDDETMERCAWHTKVVGKNPNTGEDMDEYRCAMAWMPILQIEMSSTNRGQTAAIESFRNETVNQQEQMIDMATRRLT